MPGFLSSDWSGLVASLEQPIGMTTDPTDPAAGGTGGTPPGSFVPDPTNAPGPAPVPGPPQQPAEEWCACCPGECCLVLPNPAQSRLCVRIENLSSPFYGPTDPLADNVPLYKPVFGGLWHQVQNYRAASSPFDFPPFWNGRTNDGTRDWCNKFDYALGADCTADGRVILTFYYQPTAGFADASATCARIVFELPPDVGPPYLGVEGVNAVKMPFRCSLNEECVGDRIVPVTVRWNDPVTHAPRNETFNLKFTVGYRNALNCPACITDGTAVDPGLCICDDATPEPQPEPEPGEVCVQTDCCPDCIPEFLCWVGTGGGCAFGLATLQYFDSIDAWHGTYTATGGGTISVRVWCDDATNTWRANLHCGGELIGTYAYNTTLSTCDPLSLVFDGNLSAGNACCPTPVVGARGTVTPGECGGGPGPDECEGWPDTLYFIPQYDDSAGTCPGPATCEGGSDDGFPFPLTKQGSDAGCCVWISEDFFQSSDTWYFEVRRCTSAVCPGASPVSLWSIQIKLRTGTGAILNSASCHARWNLQSCFDTVTESPGILASYTNDCGTLTVTDTPPP